jgi:MFS family permease
MSPEQAVPLSPSASSYRWVVLAVFCGLNLAIQLLWIAYAPVTTAAMAWYGVSERAIGALTMSFMVAFIPMSVPASWVIDSRGFRFGVGVGAALMGVCGPLRGLAGHSYPLALAATVGMAVAQPFFLNAWTKVAALWFPPGERATAVGVITLANLVGTAVGMALTPTLVERLGFDATHLVYGVFALGCSLAFFALARERPPSPPGPPGEEARSLMLDGLKHALSQPSFVIYLGMTFVGMGVFNGVMTWIEAIVRPRGLGSEDAGLLGAIVLVAGLVGAVVISPISDRHRRRRPYLVLGFALASPAVLGLGLAQSFAELALSAAVLGFFLVSTLPVGLQYAAELTRPTPEGTSSGILQLGGQLSVVFVYAMEAARPADGSFTVPLELAAVLLMGGAVAATRLVEPSASTTTSPTSTSAPVPP